MSEVDAVVVVAMPDEAAPFVALAESVGELTPDGHAEQRLLAVAGRRVLLVRSGIGHVAAATAAAVAIRTHRPRALVSAGSAGGIGRQVRVGDVVVGDRYLFAGADARAFGYDLGQIPGQPAGFDGDARLVASAAGAPDHLTVHTGTMLSGDAFVDARTVDAVRAAFPHALSTDMETTALAQTAHLAGLAFVSVRGISDLCGPVAGEDFLTHVDDAADRSAAVVLALLAALG